jgi:deoxyribose-phosphate aldolase
VCSSDLDKMIAAGAVRMGTSKGILIVKDEKPAKDAPVVY